MLSCSASVCSRQLTAATVNLEVCLTRMAASELAAYAALVQQQSGTDSMPVMVVLHAFSFDRLARALRRWPCTGCAGGPTTEQGQG